MATLQELDGIISIYLADLRYASDNPARKYSRARHYVESSRAAIKEMFRQVARGEREPGELKAELDRWDVFEEYEDRFFRLFK